MDSDVSDEGPSSSGIRVPGFRTGLSCGFTERERGLLERRLPDRETRAPLVRFDSHALMLFAVVRVLIDYLRCGNPAVQGREERRVRRGTIGASTGPAAGHAVAAR